MRRQSRTGPRAKCAMGERGAPEGGRPGNKPLTENVCFIEQKNMYVRRGPSVCFSVYVAANIPERVGP